jgi:chromate transporter
MIEDEVVRRRKWLSDEAFLDLLGATNLIPGPNSTELAIHIGWARRRWSGLVVAGVSFILPALLITGFCGWLYVRFGSLPQAEWLLYGVKPVVLAIVLQALLGLFPKAAPSWPLRALLVAAAVASAFGVHELLVLLGCGGAVILARGVVRRSRSRELDALLPLFPLAAGAAAASHVTLPALFAVFLKIGSVLFGSGYVLLAFLRADLVERLGWMTEAQLIDAVAVGQVTPGPVFTTATFIGYILAGPGGALVATLGIFLPAFFFVAVSAPFVPRLRSSPLLAALLDGVNVGSLALMGVVTFQLGRGTFSDALSVVVAAVSLFALWRLRLNTTWLIVAGAVVGWLARAMAQ